MYSYLRTKPVWMQLIIFLCLTLGCLVAVTLVGVVIVASVNHLGQAQVQQMLGSEDFADPAHAKVLKGLMIVQFFMFVIPAFVFAYLSDPQPLEYLGLRKPSRWRFFPLGIVLVLCAYFTVGLLGSLNESIVHHMVSPATRAWIEKGESGVNDALKNILDLRTPAGLLQGLFMVGIIPAVSEELFFRGVLQRLIIQLFKSPFWGIFFTGAIFSLVHFQFMGFLPRMALGMILGAMYWYSGSIYTSMIGHFVFNGFQVLLLYANVPDPSQRLLTWVGLISLLIVAFILIYLRKHSDTTYEKVFHFADPADPWDFGDSSSG